MFKCLFLKGSKQAYGSVAAFFQGPGSSDNNWLFDQNSEYNQEKNFERDIEHVGEDEINSLYALRNIVISY